MQRSIPEELKNLYPFKSNFLEIGSNKYHYLDEGQGEVIVLLHGNPTWSFYYRNLVESLRGEYRLIVPDHLGCGLSDKPKNFSYQVKDHIQNVEKLIDHLEIKKFHIIGHDWGGAISMGVATNDPDRIQKIVLMNTAAFPSPKIPFRINICRIPYLGAFLIRGLNLFTIGLTKYCSFYPLAKSVKRGYLYPYNSWKNRIGNLRFVQDIPMTSEHPSYQTIAQIEKKLKNLEDKQIFLVWGMKDFCFSPAFLNKFKQIFPNAKVKEFSKASHLVLEDEATQILPRIREFLKNDPS